MKNLNFLSFRSLSPENGSGMDRLCIGNGSAIPCKLFTLLFVLLLSVGQMWGDSYTWTFSNGDLGSSGSPSASVSKGSPSKTWSTSYTWPSGASKYLGWDNSKGVQIGSGTSTNKCTKLVLSTTGISGTITNITVNGSHASSGGAAVTIKVGSTTVKSKTNFTTTAVDYTTGTISQSGTIEITIDNSASKAFFLKSISVTYTPSGGSTPTLSSVAVSGTPTTATYESGNAFDATGLTVTGTYSDASQKTESAGITWTACKTQNGTYVALNNAAVALATNETGIYVKATVGGVTSPAYHVTGLTVTAPLPTITITQSQVESFTNSYAQYTWTAGGVSGKMYAYKNKGMQFNPNQTGYYVYNTDPIPGKIKKITMTKASGTTRSWTPYVSSSPLTSTTGGTSQTAKTVESTTTWDVTGSNRYFYLTVSGGATVIESIVITYEEVKNAVTVATPATGTGTLSVTGAADLSTVNWGTELTVTATPSAAYHGGTVKVIKTGVTPEVDVTSTVYNASTKKLIMPDYAITVSATFVADAAISVAVATGQSSWGSVKLYNSTPTEVSSGTTFKPSAGFKIEATPASDDYEFVSWAKSDGSDITLSAADAAKSNPTLTAGEVSTTFTATFRETAKPYLEVDPESLSFGPIAVNGSQEGEFALAGENLTEDASLAITGTGAAMFSVASSVAKNGDGNIIEDVTVTYNPTAAGTHTATLTISSEGADDVEVALSGEAKVLRTITWYKSDDTELTAQERGSATTSVLNGDAVTNIPSAPSSCDQAISFQGWTNATYAKSDNAPSPLYTVVGDFPAVSGGNASYYAVWAKGGTKSDVLTRETTGVTNGSSTYDDWSGKTVTSTAVYAGNSAGGNDAIQIRSKNSNSGVITTASGGKALKVSVEWQSDTQNDRTLNVYGKNSAYSAASDLFDEEERGTLIGTIVKGTSTELTISGDYAYIGVCSADGAIYLTSLTVQWSSKSDYATTCSVPVEIADPTFSPAAGTYDDDQSVTLGFASPATAVYYTTDGTSDPKVSGTLYSSAISVTSDMTIKAAATDGNGNWSNVVTKTYTINYSPSIAAYIAKAQATSRYLRLNDAQNCIITGIREYVSGNNDKWDIYMQDASNKGIIIYGLSALPSGAAVGKRIGGAISGTYSLGNGQPRITSADLSNATFNNADALTPASISAVNADAYTANPVMLVKLSGVYYKEISSGNYIFSANNDGSGTQNTIYDTFKYLNGKTMPANTVACDITGILINYNGTTPELLALELTTAATAALPTIDPEGGADAENAEEVTYLTEISVGSVANEDIIVKLNDVEKTDANPILVQGDLKLDVIAKRDFYADNSVTYYYKPSAYPKNIDVTSVHGTVVVKVGDNVVETALPGATVNFTVTPESGHFHITSTSVTYEGGSLTPSVNNNVYSFTMPDKDATIVVNYTEDTKYSITFNGGGAEGEGPAAFEDQYAGTEITLPTKEEANYTAPTDKVFNGWVVTSGEDEVEQNNGKFDMPAGNVTIEAQWADRVYCALTLNINGATTTTNIDREVKYILPTEEDPISGYDFYGWTEAPEVDDVEDAIDTIKSFTPAANEASKTLYAVFKRTETGAQKTDVLTHADFNATSTGYVEFSNVQKNSNAKYAGKTALNGTQNIQINKKAENGIYSSVSGGTLVSVTIAMTSNSNALGIYASNTAFTGYTGIPSQTGSTEIGTLASETSKTITPSSDYKYVGIASKNDGAKYIQSITIVWQPKTTYYTTAPAQVYDVTYNLGTSPAGTWKENEGCDDTKVKSGLTYDICEDEPIREHFNFNGWLVGGQVASGTITITGNTEIVADWVAKVESTLTYDKGTASGTNVVTDNVEEGTEITLPAIGTGEGQVDFTKDGYDFKGWKYGNKLYKAGETFVMPAINATLEAQWKKQNTEKFTLVTEASQLVNGSKVVLANQAKKTVAGASGAETDSYLASVDATFDDTKSIITDINAGIQLILVEYGDGWALMYNDKYLKPHSTNKISWDTTPTKWYISINGNDAKIETGLENSGSALRYNSNSGSLRFSAYSSKSSCDPIQLYASSTVVTGTMSISDLGYVEDEAIVASGENVTLTIDVPIRAQSITAKDGATVVIEAETTAKDVVVEDGSKIVADAEIQTPVVHFATTLGSSQTPSSGTAISEAQNIILAAGGEIHYDITLGTSMAGVQADPNQWHAFTVPFPVDVLNGIYNAETGAKLANEVDYAIMDYHGDIRANGQYGWKKFRGTLVPGTFYIMTVNGDVKTFRFKMSVAAATVLQALNSMAYTAYGVTDPENTTSDQGWNGIGNPSWVSVIVEYPVQVLDPYSYEYRTLTAGTVISASTPFFYKASSSSSMTMTESNANVQYAPARTPAKEIKEMAVSFGNEVYKDMLYVTASEDALNSYEQDKDLVKMTMSKTPKIAQIFGNAYGMKLSMVNTPLVNNTAEVALELYAPQAGEYTIAAPNMENADLYLTKDGAIIWNLTMSEYPISLNKGTTEGYGLLLKAKAPQTPTGVEQSEVSHQPSDIQKIIIDDNVFILRGGKMYDVTGKAVK